MRLLDTDGLLAALIEGFKDHTAGLVIEAGRFPLPLNDAGSAMLLAPGTLPSIPAYSEKVHAKFPDAPPAIKGVLLLHDIYTGDVLAIMDSTYLTAVRTGLVGAYAAHLLARPDDDRVCVAGAGVQGEFMPRNLISLRAVSEVAVVDNNPENARNFIDLLANELELPMVQASLDTALSTSRIVLAATWATEPFLNLDNVAPGTHITSLGPDQPGKAEVHPDLLRKSLLVCDDIALAEKLGALQPDELGPTQVHATLGEVLSDVKPGRGNGEEITVFAAAGLTFQDLAAAWHVYVKAREAGEGLTLDLMGWAAHGRISKPWDRAPP